MKKITENIHKYMEDLCLNTGSKHCGSPELEKAGKYIENIFKDNGFEVIKEEFPIRGWEFNSFSLFDVTEGCEVPASSACFFSNSVDICEAPLWITYKEINNLENLPVKGRLCFVASWVTDSKMGVFGYNAISEKLDKLGAAAAIFLSREGYTQLAPNTKIQRSPFLDKLGTVVVAEEGAIYMANRKDHIYHLKIDAKCFDTTTYNIIARIGNGSKKGVIGAHYDTAPLVQGAQDNIGGVVVMMEAARLLKDRLLTLKDEWTFDFVAFSAEEYIPYTVPLGSGTYVENHKNENIKWLVNIDDVANHFADPEIAISHREKLPDIEYPYEVREATLAGDDKTFSYAGIPTVWIYPKKIYAVLHTAMDNLEHADFERMEEVTFEYMDIISKLTESDF